MKIYNFYSDPGHGWLEVKRSELAFLGILETISGFSYQKGDSVFLEEDCDAPKFFRAKDAAGVVYSIKDVYQEETPIRNYQHFAA